jgi:ATP-dependent Clp protease ATP-binding subunit ClpA
LERTLHLALACANQREHEYATLEHLLLALLDDADASAVMKACKVDLGALRDDLVGYIDGELDELVIRDNRDAKPTAGFQRVVQRAAIRAKGLGRDATGADLLVAIFDERESHAAWFLSKQDITQEAAANSVLHAIVHATARGGRGPGSRPRSS